MRGVVEVFFKKRKTGDGCVFYSFFPFQFLIGIVTKTEADILESKLPVFIMI
jgi:hypothetical protein